MQAEFSCVCSFLDLRSQVNSGVGKKGRKKMMFPLGAGHYCFAVVNR